MQQQHPSVSQPKQAPNFRRRTDLFFFCLNSVHSWFSHSLCLLIFQLSKFLFFRFNFRFFFSFFKCSIKMNKVFCQLFISIFFSYFFAIELVLIRRNAFYSVRFYSILFSSPRPHLKE